MNDSFLVPRNQFPILQKEKLRLPPLDFSRDFPQPAAHTLPFFNPLVFASVVKTETEIRITRGIDESELNPRIMPNVKCLPCGYVGNLYIPGDCPSCSAYLTFRVLSEVHIKHISLAVHLLCFDTEKNTR